jgi:hypothetical protein
MAKEKARQGREIHLETDIKEMANPVVCKEGKGVRNFGCPYYDMCLDKAAKGMWSGFTCKECIFYKQETEEGSS